MWVIGFALMFVSSMVVFGLELRDKIRARSLTPAYRYYWFPAVALCTALIVGAILAAVYAAIPLFLLFYFVGSTVVAVPSAVALISLLYYCPRVGSRNGNLAFRGLSIVLAVVIALLVCEVWRYVGIGKELVERSSIALGSIPARA